MRLLRRLEKSVEGGEWNDGAEYDIWIRTRGTLRVSFQSNVYASLVDLILQKVQYAEHLLKDLKLHDADTSSFVLLADSSSSDLYIPGRQCNNIRTLGREFKEWKKLSRRLRRYDIVAQPGIPP
jgi:hypothetical protein